jgi:ribose/xylose/arabinose/galactoside ABC-type transport system permease subunit
LFVLLIGKSFATFGNIHTILRQSTIVCIAALGATFIIISAGIDLSIGSAVALCTMVLAAMLKMTFSDGSGQSSYLSVYPILWPIVCAIASIIIGLLAGLLNGLLVTGLRLVPFIATLGTMMIYRGLTETISVVQINPEHNWLEVLMREPDLPKWVLHSPARAVLQWLYLAPAIWVTLVLAVIMAVVLQYFRFGRYSTAVGSNEQTARLCGIPVNRMKLFIYAVGGLFLGIASIMQYSRLGQSNPAGGLGMELDVIAAVVIGGASLNGGKGSILGTMIGALIMTVIASGCMQVPIPHWVPERIGVGIGLQPGVQKIVTGLIIIVAVFIDNLRQKRPS